MEKRGQNLLDLLVGRQATKAAQVTAGQYLAAAGRRQALGRERAANQWVYRQGAGSVSRDVLRDRALLLRQGQQRQRAWVRQNAALLQRYPQLQRYATYFSQNPQAWQKFQDDAGMSSGAASPVAASTPRTTPVSSATGMPSATTEVPVTRQSVPTPDESATAKAVGDVPSRTSVSASPTDTGSGRIEPPVPIPRPQMARVGMTYDAYQERLRKMRTPPPGYKPPSPKPYPAKQPAPAQKTPPPSQAQTPAVTKLPGLRRPTAVSAAGTAPSAGVQPSQSVAAPATPRVVTWSPGQPLPGMSRRQTAAYEGKIPKMAELLRAALYKRAQEIVTDEVAPDEYSRSVDAMLAQRKQQAAAAEALKNESKRGLTGNKDYDALPDVVARREQENEKARREEWLAKDPGVVQQKDMRTVQKEIDANGGVSDFGDSRVGRAVGGFFANTIGRGVDALGKGIGYLKAAPKGTAWSDWSKQYDQIANQSRGDVAHDIANNFQLQTDNARHGAETVGRFAARYLDPRNLRGNSDDIRRQRSQENEWANADKAYYDRQRRILGNFRDRDLAQPGKSTLGMLNYAGNAALGEFAGGEAATAGLGGAAKGIGKGIQYGTKAVAGQAGKLTTRAVAPLAEKARYVRSGFGQQARNLESFRTDLLRHGQSLGADPAHPLMQQLASPKAFRKAWARSMGSANPQARQIAAGRAGISLKPGSQALEQRIGGAVSRGITEIGDTLATPFTLAGKASTPITTVGRNPAVQAAFNPAVRTLQGMAHPLQSARSLYGAGRFALQHPVRAIGRVATSPVRYGYSIAKPAVGQAWKGVWSMPGARAWTMYDAYGNAQAGNYGQAAANIGTMGAFGAGVIPGAAALAGTAYLANRE